nr:M48 family metalloprotease [Sphingomonas bacterium]
MPGSCRTLPIAAALLLAGCGGAAPEQEAPHVSEADRGIGAEQHPQLLAEFGGAYPGEEAQYVSRLGGNIAAAAGLEGQCTFTLVNSDVVNAFAVPGCYIYVTRGLMAIVTSEAQLASVLGHEVGHIVAAHSQRQQRRSLWRTLGVIAVGLTGSQTLTRLAGEAAQFFTLRYSRNQEYQADDLGIGYLVEAGYDPHAAAGMLGALARQEAFMVGSGGRDVARSIPEWARSHPLTAHRIQRARDAADATGIADGALPENAPAYLAEVDGLLYGDDPAQGFVSGRRFAHPIMRIGFEAPAGFTLTNSPQAIRLSGPGGLRGEFGGGALPAGSDLDGYAEALARQVLGDTPAAIAPPQRIVINGVRALILSADVTTQSGAVPLSIAAFDGGGGRAFHFVMIAPPGDGNAAAVAALFRSFHLLSEAEAARLRPRVIRVVQVRSGDTLETLTAAMAGDHPRAELLMLNDRRAETPLRPGERVKIVTNAAPGATD